MQSNYTVSLLDSLETVGYSVISVIPRLLAAALILVVGWLIARLIGRGIGRLLRAARFNQLADKVGATDLLKRARVKVGPSALLGRFVYYILMLVVIITAAETVGWTAVSVEISKLLSYLPQLFSALVFFLIGFYIVTFVRDLIRGASSSLGITAGRVISSVVYYVLLLIVTLTALDQAGVNTDIITSNMLVVVGSVMLAASIAYGFASRDVLTNILAGYFSRRSVSVGQLIEVDGMRGRITKMTSLSVTLRISPGETIILPSRTLITHPIRVIEE